MTVTTSTALRVTLVVSLALNLFIAGIFAGSFWRHGSSHHPHRWHAAHVADPRALRRALPVADKHLLDQAMPAHREQIRERMQAVREARKQVSEALRAEPFDQDALAEAFASLREREMAMAEEAQLLLIQVAGQASSEGRTRMAQQMLQHRRPRQSHPEAPPPRHREPHAN